MLVLICFVVANMRRGVFALTADLAALVLSVLLAFRFYPWVQAPLERLLPESFATAFGFIVVFVLAQLVLAMIARRLLAELPLDWHEAPASRALSVVPALAQGVLFVGIFLLILLALPANPDFKRDVQDARIAGAILDRAEVAERAFYDVFSDAIHESFSFLTIDPEPADSIDLDVTPDTLTVDEAAEMEMLHLVNEARTYYGLPPVEWDPELAPVARAHSQDMWERGYFSHVNPDGDDPFDRIRAAGVMYRAAGENLALAPSTVVAHEGLMDSPGHRRNILDPAFTRLGIGVIDGGRHGLMYTQLFAY